jgi:hypothetical protein
MLQLDLAVLPAHPDLGRVTDFSVQVLGSSFHAIHRSVATIDVAITLWSLIEGQTPATLRPL